MADRVQKQVEHKAKATFWVLVCVSLWALIPVVSKLGQTALDNHQFLFWSSLVSFLVLFVTALGRGKFAAYGRISFKTYLFLFFLGLLGTYIYYLFLYLGYSRAKGMEVLVVQYTWPIFIMILSLFILKESMNWRKGFAVLFGFSGVITVLTRGEYKSIHFDNGTVILLVLLGAFCFALYSVLSKTILIDPVVAASIYFFIAAAASFCSMLYFSSWQLPQISELLPVLLNGILVNGFSYVFWIFALQAAKATYVTPFTYLTPVLSAVYLVLFFREPFLPSYGIGLMLVLAGGMINSIKTGKYPQREGV